MHSHAPTACGARRQAVAEAWEARQRSSDPALPSFVMGARAAPCFCRPVRQRLTPLPGLGEAGWRRLMRCAGAVHGLTRGVRAQAFTRCRACSTYTCTSSPRCARGSQ